MALFATYGVSGCGQTPAQVAQGVQAPAPAAKTPIYRLQGGAEPQVPPPVGTARVAFQSCRFGGGGFGDIFVYDFNQDTVMALPAVNTPAAEVNPEISANGRWLVYQTNINGNWDLRLFDMQSMLINTLDAVNTLGDETQPDISDGCQIVFVHYGPGGPFDALQVYDRAQNASFIVPVRGVYDVTWPAISADGSTIAFGAMGLPFGTQDIYMWHIGGPGVVTPPFVNGPANDYNPELSADGRSMLFVSDRNGTEDIYMLQPDGFLNNLVFANTSFSDEQEPRFLDGGTVLYQTTGAGAIVMHLTGIDSGLVDTLPIASAGGILNAQLRSYLPNGFDPFPGSPFLGGFPDGCGDVFGCGGGLPYPGPIGFPGPIGGPVGPLGGPVGPVGGPVGPVGGPGPVVGPVGGGFGGTGGFGGPAPSPSGYEDKFAPKPYTPVGYDDKYKNPDEKKDDDDKPKNPWGDHKKS